MTPRLARANGVCDTWALAGSNLSAETGSARRCYDRCPHLTSCPHRGPRANGGQVMSHVKRRLPAQPHIDVPKREARELLAGWRARAPDVYDRIRAAPPRYREADLASLAAATFRLSDAQLVIAREYNFASWAALNQRIAGNQSAAELETALRAGDTEHVVALLRSHPPLLHLPVRSGNWGPPMSFAANLGRLDLVEAIAALGARDHQHAFDRAVLQGHTECARWLRQRGAAVTASSVMGPCETLD